MGEKQLLQVSGENRMVALISVFVSIIGVQTMMGVPARDPAEWSGQA